jgi:thioredoxin 1
MTELTMENFEAEVMKETKLTVVDFWAVWCGPCKMLSPIVDALSEEMTDVKFCKVNIDEQQELAMQFRIESIPTLLFVKNGKIVKKLVGFRPKEDVKKEIEASK